MKKITLKERLENFAEERFGCELGELTKHQLYKTLCTAMRDILSEKNRDFAKRTRKKNVYYMSMEFLVGTSLKNNIFNLGLENEVKEAIEAAGMEIVQINHQGEWVNITARKK